VRRAAAILALDVVLDGEAEDDQVIPVPNDAGRQLASLSWTEIAERIDADSVILLPIGAVEAHGPHLGLDTDVIIAQAAAQSAADRFTAIEVDAWIAPPVWYGVSFVGRSFPGTTPVAPDPFRGYLEWVLRGLHGIAGSDVIVVNAHLEPAHFDAIQSACSAISVETGGCIHAVDHRASRWACRLGDEFSGGSRHAGSYETSIVLAVDPVAVRTDLLSGLAPVWVDLPARLRAGARTFDEAGGTQAYFGDPARSTSEEGRRLLDALGAIVVESFLEARSLIGR
jgi:creatinine amidohydrolase